MHLTDLLTTARVAIRSLDGAASGAAAPKDKAEALALVARLLARGTAAQVDAAELERALLEREHLQSTGIGEGVAIPHGALAPLEQQVAALLILPEGIEFDAIDGRKVSLIFAVVGPKRATGEHLKTLARVSRLLRHQSFRERLIAAPTPEAAFELMVAEEGDPR